MISYSLFHALFVEIVFLFVRVRMHVYVFLLLLFSVHFTAPWLEEHLCVCEAKRLELVVALVWIWEPLLNNSCVL